MEAAAESLFKSLEQIPDPRRARGVRHPFQAIVRLTLLGLVSGQTRHGAYSVVRETALAGVEGAFGLCAGERSPRHHYLPCIGRSPIRATDALIDWVKGVVGDYRVTVSVDGKWAKQSEDAWGNPLGMVNVLAHDLKLCLAQCR